MAGQRKGSWVPRSIAGTALAGLGMFIFYGNLTGELTRLTHLLGANGSAALGVLPAVILSVSQILQAYAAGHEQFLRGFVEHMFLTSWPLLLVTAGTALSRDVFTGRAAATSLKKD
jgi:hypothetical protein